MREPTRAWPEAWQAALYGPEGFYRRSPGPAGHFRTASHAAPGPLAAALTRLVERSGATAVLDVGAGRGELLTALAARTEPVSLVGVDLVDRPAGLPAGVGWSNSLAAVPASAWAGALVIAWELLDVVPCPVLEVDDDGRLRAVHVEPDGTEHLAGDPDGADLAWCRRWWPPAGPGARVEVGRPRDELWSQLVQHARRFGAVALLCVDYAHHCSGRPPFGTLTGYRDGRLVPPVPDCSCDLTAHVALDAVAAAGEQAGACTTALTDQRTALRELGLTGRAVPDEPVTAAALVRRSAAAELLDAGGLGGFGWLVQSVPT